MARRRYAEDTSITTGKSREGIDRLLRRWDCDQVQWGDDYKAGLAQLRFAWEHESTRYVARFSLPMPTDEELKDLCTSDTGRFYPGKLERLQHRRGWPEHRQLHLWLLACFNAVEAGIITAELVFFPHLEGSDGTTIGEAMLPRLPKLLNRGGAKNLLPSEV